MIKYTLIYLSILTHARNILFYLDEAQKTTARRLVQYPLLLGE